MLQPLVQLSCQVLAVALVLLAAGLPQPSVQNSVKLLLLLQVILSSPRGRAWNQYSPSLGSTMNVAFLAQVYANYIKPGGGSEAKKAKRYSCWAQTQVCYSLDVCTTCVVTLLKKLWRLIQLLGTEMQACHCHALHLCMHHNSHLLCLVPSPAVLQQ